MYVHNLNTAMELSMCRDNLVTKVTDHDSGDRVSIPMSGGDFPHRDHGHTGSGA
jgi:hypothetical protein